MRTVPGRLRGSGPAPGGPGWWRGATGRRRPCRTLRSRCRRSYASRSGREAGAGGTVPRPGCVADDEPVTRSIWLRAALLGLLLVVGAVVAATVDLPDVHTLRGWLDGAGGVGWGAVVLGLAVLLLAPVPRSVVSVLIGLVAGFWAGLGVALL